MRLRARSAIAWPTSRVWATSQRRRRRTAPIVSRDTGRRLARVAARHDELVRELAERGQSLEHCRRFFCADDGCECDCPPCVRLEELLNQAEREVLEAGRRAGAVDDGLQGGEVEIGR